MITKSDNTSTDVLYRVAGTRSRPCRSASPESKEDHRPTIGELLRMARDPCPASPSTSLADQFRRMSPKRASERRAKAYRRSPPMMPTREIRQRQLQCWGSCARSGWRTGSADRARSNAASPDGAQYNRTESVSGAACLRELSSPTRRGRSRVPLMTLASLHCPMAMAT